MNRKGERVQRGQKRMWCSGGGGKIFVAGGKAGLTGQQQRLLVLPGFLLKTRTPPHTPPPHTHIHAPRSCMSSIPPSPPLSASLSSLPLLSRPFPHPQLLSACSLFLPPLLSLPHRPHHSLLLHVWAITDTQQRG